MTDREEQNGGKKYEVTKRESTDSQRNGVPSADTVFDAAKCLMHRFPMLSRGTTS